VLNIEVSYCLLLIVVMQVGFYILNELSQGNNQAEKELVIRQKELSLRELEAVGTLCESQSGNIDYKGKGLDCNDKQSGFNSGSPITQL
jgi:hypothetical protein